MIYHNQNKVTILGASGFIGKFLYYKFSSNDQLSVTGYSRNSCDLLSLKNIQSALSSKMDGSAVVLAAAITRHRDNSYGSMIKNIQMVENVCDVISDNPIAHITFLSTVDVYGVNIDDKTEIDESFLPAPSDYYSLSKITAELLLKLFCVKRSIPLTILRLPGVYGPGDNFKSTIGLLTKNAFKHGRMILYNSGDNLRDFVYVDDVYKIIKSAIEQRKNVLVNVATGKSISISEIAAIIKELIPLPIEIQHKVIEPGSENRIDNLRLKCKQIADEFPEVSMTDIKKGIIYYINNVKKRQKWSD